MAKSIGLPLKDRRLKFQRNSPYPWNPPGVEKKDAEQLSILRSTNEVNVVNAVRQIREKQIHEAKEIIEGLRKSKITIETRRDYYADLPL